MTRWQWLGLAAGALGIVLLTLALGITIGKGCGGVAYVQPVGIDAGPGDRVIAAELDASLRREDERMAALLAEHEREIAEIHGRETAEFERVRSEGRDALAVWFKERTLRLLGDGGR